MKMRFVNLVWISIVSSFSFVTYGQKDTLETGWYYISGTNTGIERTAKIDGKKYSIISEPIVLKEDFEAIKLSVFTKNDGSTFYEIVMSLKSDKVEAFRLATKKSVGNQIGLIICNELVNVPHVNAEITSGHSVISGTDEAAFLRYLADLQTAKTLKPDATVFPPETMMRIAKGENAVPDSVKKEFNKKWRLMNESWKSSFINLSSNSADYMATVEYKSFKNYILTTDSMVLYLFADKYMEAPLGLYAHFLIDLVNTKNPDFKKDMDAIYHRDKSDYTLNVKEMRSYLNYLLTFSELRNQFHM